MRQTGNRQTDRRMDHSNKSVFSLVNSAVNMTLPAFAAERRAAAPLLLSAGARRCRSPSSARGALSSKPSARRCRFVARKNRRTDGRTLDRFVDPASHTVRAMSVINSVPD